MPLREYPSHVIAEGLAMGECTRWHGGQFWCADWMAGDILRFDEAGRASPVAHFEGAPFSFDRLPGGELAVVSATHRGVLRQEADGALALLADLSVITHKPWNEIVAAANGDIYVNSIGFDMMAGEAAGPLGVIALVRPGEQALQVASGLAFPNGMCITPDGTTLIAAESHARRLTAFTIAFDGTLSGQRTWADCGAGAPDGICIDGEGAVWYADVPNQRCVRVAEGGEELAWVSVDRGCFACMLGGPQGTTLYIAANKWLGPDAMGAGTRTGQILIAEVDVPHAGWP